MACDILRTMSFMPSYLFEVPESAASVFEMKEIFCALNRLLPKFQVSEIRI